MRPALGHVVSIYSFISDFIIFTDVLSKQFLFNIIQIRMILIKVVLEQFTTAVNTFTLVTYLEFMLTKYVCFHIYLLSVYTQGLHQEYYVIFGLNYEATPSSLYSFPFLLVLNITTTVQESGIYAPVGSLIITHQDLICSSIISQ